MSVDSIAVKRLRGKRTALIPEGLGEPAYFGMKVTVTNHTDGVVFATSTVTGLDYVARTRTLKVSIRAPGLLGPLVRPLAAEHVRVEPGLSGVIDARIASPVTQLGRSGKPNYVFLDGEVERYEVTVSYTDSEPPKQINLAARSSVAQTEWQTATGRSDEAFAS